MGEALIERLQVEPGQRVLDVACGTGEPALTLARRWPELEVEGVDAAEGMVKAAQAKAEREGLSNVRFRAMPAEHLAFADASFHRVICRFGVMLFQDPLQGLKEMHRVLMPGGRVAVAVWGSADSLPSFRWHHEVFRERLPEELHPPLEKVASLSEPGALERLMEQAGFRKVEVESRQVEYRFDSFDYYWNTVEASQVLARRFQALPKSSSNRYATKWPSWRGNILPMAGWWCRTGLWRGVESKAPADRDRERPGHLPLQGLPR